MTTDSQIIQRFNQLAAQFDDDEQDWKQICRDVAEEMQLRVEDVASVMVQHWHPLG